METTLPEPLLASTLHGVENVDPSNPNPNKPVASINDTMYQQVSTLRGANDTVVKKHTETITVAENLTRELATAAPFQKVNMTTLEQVEVMAEQAEQVLEEARAQVQESNERVLEQEKINFQTYQTYKRNRNDAVPQVAEAQRKRQKVESGVATLAEAMISTLGDGGNDDERWLEGALQTTEGCKQLLDRQMILMQELKKEKNTVVEEAERLQDQIQPLKSAVQDLRAVSNNQGQGTSNDGKNVMSELNATCAWYENVNRLICAVSGTSVIHRPDAFGDHSLQIKVDSTILTPNKLTASATLEVRFEPKTTNVVFARLVPNVAPLSDIVASCAALDDNGSALLRLVRESRVRIGGAAKRDVEFSALKKKYVVQWNYGGKTKNSEPEAAAWMYVRVTIPGVGIVVEMRAPPDYPQMYTDVKLTQVVGVMGWSKQELSNLKTVACNSGIATTVTEMVENIEEAIKSSALPVDVA